MKRGNNMRVGDYVRTKNYGIAKILNTYNNTTTNYSSITLDKIDSFGRLGVSVGNNNIIKSSPNIIDLVEVGDYVNGYEVTSKDQFLGFGNHDWYMTNDEIKSIVTKEQFEAMKYEL